MAMYLSPISNIFKVNNDFTANYSIILPKISVDHYRRGIDMVRPLTFPSVESDAPFVQTGCRYLQPVRRSGNPFPRRRSTGSCSSLSDLTTSCTTLVGAHRRLFPLREDENSSIRGKAPVVLSNWTSGKYHYLQYFGIPSSCASLWTGGVT